MKETTLFVSSMDSTFEEDIALITNSSNKKMNSYNIEYNDPNFYETSSLVIIFDSYIEKYHLKICNLNYKKTIYWL